jgi:AbrB family looped-hinge helix DNA binding protein
MSSKGQVVIPQEARRRIKATEGTLFAVVAQDDTIILRKVSVPSREDVMKRFNELAAETQKSLEAQGWTEQKVIAASLRERYSTRTSGSAQQYGKQAKR